MLKAWGVDTVVLVGAWTDDCIAATAFDAVDRYGLDMVPSFFLSYPSEAALL